MPDVSPHLFIDEGTPGQQSATTRIAVTPSAGSAPTVVDVPTEGGQRIGRYVATKIIGQGGFGRVYLAVDPALHRSLAIKVPRTADGWTDAKAGAILAEARLAAQLKHPHVVTIHDFGPDPEFGVYLAMEYVEGSSLSVRLQEGPLPVADAVRVVSQVAEAMHHAHKLGVIHRDLKPANILLDHAGQAKVTDFGLAVAEVEQSLRRGEISGTPGYMAPEQFRGEVQHFDGRTDIWSLGVILYECLSGKRPFQGATRSDVREQVLERSPKPLRQIDDTIPKALDDLCQACLQKDPADRPATAGDVVAALRRVLQPAQTREKFGFPAQLATLAVSVGLLSVGGLVWSPQRKVEPMIPVAAAQDNGPQNLLNITPTALIFGYDDPQSHFGSGPDGRFNVATRQPAYFSWPDVQPEHFTWTTTWLFGKDLLGTSLMWNLRRGVNEHGLQGYHARALAIFPEKTPGTYRLQMRDVWLQGVHPGPVRTRMYKGLGRSQSLTLDETLPVRIRLRIENGNLRDCIIQGQTITWPDEVASAAESDRQNLQNSASLGLTVFAGQVVLTESLLQPERPR